MPDPQAIVAHTSAPLPAVDTHQQLWDLITHENAPELISPWVAYDLATRVGTPFCVVPPRGLTAKQPKAPVGKWEHWQHQRPTDADLWQWYIEEQRTGVGIVLGAVSGHLHCLEWEGIAVQSGFYDACLHRFTELGLHPVWERISSYVERSPKGGIHVYYRLREERRKRVLARSSDNATYCEDLGEGNYVIVAPSHGVNEAGPYTALPVWPSDTDTEHRQDRELERTLSMEQLLDGHLFLEGPVIETADIDALHQAVRDVAAQWWPQEQPPARQSSALPTVSRAEHSSTLSVFELLQTAPDIDETVMWCLEQLGWKRGRPWKGGTLMTKPGGRAGDEHGAVGGDVPGLFHCYTTEGHPFEAERWYKPGEVYAIALHGGDLYAAARDLEQKLGLQRPKRNRVKRYR